MRQANVVYPLQDRQDFSIIYHELWDYYLPYLGSGAALLYCFLQRKIQEGLPGPSSREWAALVCSPLGLSVADSHQAWARLQEMGLITVNNDGSYSLANPKQGAEFEAAFADLRPRQQEFPAINLTPSLAADAAARAKRLRRAERSLYSLVEQEFGRTLNSTEGNRLQAMEAAYARELVELAVEIAVINQALNLAYVEQVLLNWKEKGIATAQAARADSQQFRLQKARRQSGRSAAKSARKQAPGGNKPNIFDDLDFYRSSPAKKEEGDSR